MGLTEEQIGVKMRLMGKAEYVAGMDASTESTVAYGDAVEKAGVQARDASGKFTGSGKAAASASKVGIGAMARMKKVGEGFKSAGATMTKTFTLPIVLLGGVGVKSALDFSDAMEQIHTQAGASQSEVTKMTKAVMGFAASGKSSEGPNQLAEGLYSIESAGFRGKRALEAMTRSEQLATVGHADFGKTSKAVAAAMSTQIKGTKNLGETVGLMNSIVGVGSMRMEDLLSAMGTGLLDKSAAIGLSLREVGAGLGVLTTTGTPAAAASTRMSMAFGMMAAPTEKAAKAMEGIGLTESQLALGMRKKGLVPTIELLKRKLSETFGNSKAGLVKQSKAVSEMFGGGRTSGGIISLMRHVGLLKSKYDELGGSQKKFQGALKATDEQPITKLHRALAQGEAALIELGNILIPYLTKAVKFFSGLISGFSKLSPATKKYIVIGLALLAVIGPIVSLIGTLIIAVSALGTALEFLALNPVGIVITAVALAAVGFYLLYTKVEWFHNAINDIVNFIKAHPWLLLLAGPIPQIIGLIILLVQHFGWVKNAIKNVIHFFQLLPGRAIAALQALPGEIKNLVVKAVIFFALFPIKAPIYFVKFVAKVISILLGLLPKLPGIGLKIITFIWHGMSTAASKLWGWIKELAPKMLHAVMAIAGQLVNVGAEMAKSIAKGLKNELLSILPGPVKDALEGAGGVAGEVGGFIGGAIGELASGSSFTQGGITLVGERGPELVHMPRGAEVWNAARTRRVESHVGPLRHRGGPSPVRAENGAQRGAGGGRRPRPVEVRVPVMIGRRQFGEGMAMAMIDEEENE